MDETTAEVKLFSLGNAGDVIVKKLAGKAAEFYLNNNYLGWTENIRAWTTFVVSHDGNSLVGMIDGKYSSWTQTEALRIGDTITFEAAIMRPDITNLEFY